MKYNLDFGTLISSKKITSKILSFFNEAYELNSKLFNKKYTHLKFIVCNSEKEYRKEAKYYYSKYSIGKVLRDGTFIIKNDKIINRGLNKFRKIIFMR